VLAERGEWNEVSAIIVLNRAVLLAEMKAFTEALNKSVHAAACGM